MKTVEAEYYVLWDDKTWDDCHFHTVPILGDEENLWDAARNHADELLSLSLYRKAIMLIPACVPAQDWSRDRNVTLPRGVRT